MQHHNRNSLRISISIITLALLLLLTTLPAAHAALANTWCKQVSAGTFCMNSSAQQITFNGVPITGTGTGDLTDLYAGQGITITDGAGPTPTVAISTALYTNSSHGQTAYDWGNHANAGYITITEALNALGNWTQDKNNYTTTNNLANALGNWTNDKPNYLTNTQSDARYAGNGTVNSITCGNGLTGGTITNTGTCAINTSYAQQRITGNCNGQTLVSINQDGSVNCEADDAGSSGANNISSVTITGTTTKTIQINDTANHSISTTFNDIDTDTWNTTAQMITAVNNSGLNAAYLNGQTASYYYAASNPNGYINTVPYQNSAAGWTNTTTQTTTSLNVGIDNTAPNASLHVVGGIIAISNSTTTVPFTAQAYPGQTSNILEIKNGTGGTRSYFSSAGSPNFEGASAFISNNLNQGQDTSLIVRAFNAKGNYIYMSGNNTQYNSIIFTPTSTGATSITNDTYSIGRFGQPTGYNIIYGNGSSVSAIVRYFAINNNLTSPLGVQAFGAGTTESQVYNRLTGDATSSHAGITFTSNPNSESTVISGYDGTEGEPIMRVVARPFASDRMNTPYNANGSAVRLVVDQKGRTSIGSPASLRDTADQLDINPSATTTVGINIDLLASHSANALQVKNSTGGVIYRVENDGDVGVTGTGAAGPQMYLDSSIGSAGSAKYLANGRARFWFNGSSGEATLDTNEIASKDVLIRNLDTAQKIKMRVGSGSTQFTVNNTEVTATVPINLRNSSGSSLFSVNTTGDLSVNTITITNPPVLCNGTNYFMVGGNGATTTCAAINTTALGVGLYQTVPWTGTPSLAPQTPAHGDDTYFMWDAGVGSLIAGDFMSGPITYGNASLTIGTDSKALGYNSVAMGWNALANDEYTTAIGDLATACYSEDVAIGSSSYANSTGGTNPALAVGAFAVASGDGSIAVGKSAYVEEGAQRSMVFGRDVYVNSGSWHSGAFGEDVEIGTNTNQSFIFGYGGTNNLSYSTAIAAQTINALWMTNNSVGVFATPISNGNGNSLIVNANTTINYGNKIAFPNASGQSPSAIFARSSGDVEINGTNVYMNNIGNALYTKNIDMGNNFLWNAKLGNDFNANSKQITYLQNLTMRGVAGASSFKFGNSTGANKVTMDFTDASATVLNVGDAWGSTLWFGGNGNQRIEYANSQMGFYTQQAKGMRFYTGSGATLQMTMNNSNITILGQLITQNFAYLGCSAVNEGAIVYNSTAHKHFGCNSTDWNALY